MKVLFLHNFYKLLGGEDLCYEAEVKLLREQGHEVIPIIRDNREIKRSWKDLTGITAMKMVASTIWSQSAYREIQAAIAKHRPDVMHCNNLFPQLSASVYTPARDANVPVVQALHNYRYFCANSFFFRDGKVCTDCLGLKCAIGGIKHGCYRDSRAASSVVAAMQYTQRSLGIWTDMVDVYFTPSHFAREVYIRGGFDPEQIRVKANFIDPDPGPGSGKGNYALFVGRLSTEKGIDVLLQAWRMMTDPPPLKIIGDGPLRAVVEQAGKELQSVEYLGPRSHSEILNVLGDARFLVMTSVWYETFGRTIAEAFSRGTPVIASRLGAMEELIEDESTGCLFEVGSAVDLARQVSRLNRFDDVQVLRMRTAARESFLQNYTATTTYRQLLEIYRLASVRAKQKQAIRDLARGNSGSWLRPSTWQRRLRATR